MKPFLVNVLGPTFLVNAQPARKAEPKKKHHAPKPDPKKGPKKPHRHPIGG